MLFEAARYAASLGLPLASEVVPTRGPLTLQEASTLVGKLEDDSQKLIYSSLLSIAVGLRGLELQYTTWPTINFYYSCFYSIRAILALSSVCLYYDAKKPRSLECLVGKLPSQPPGNVRGSTHKFAFDAFSRRFKSSPILSQTIDSQTPFDWLMKRREDANYNVARFVEPSESVYFSYVKRSSIRKLCVEYLQDASYAFDPDHALMAYPLMLIKHIEGMGVKGHSCIQGNVDDQKYEGYLVDVFGPLQPLLQLKKSVLL
ncbi:hypothetical protein [Bradyrhizobium manausense]|uniref:hypothetical protein n=1 Tax=Bradyrhizobium manausense TaxID=989370 RepID=UPI001BA517D8|nr:hypothetical protein [Bradyrhizobium manausense]MBR0725296.1 hypothetical protein [Bradyrhizobium manausense]